MQSVNGGSGIHALGTDSGCKSQVKVQDADGHIIDEDDDRDGDRYQRRTIMTTVTGGTSLAMSGTDCRVQTTQKGMNPQSTCQNKWVPTVTKKYQRQQRQFRAETDDSPVSGRTTQNKRDKGKLNPVRRQDSSIHEIYMGGYHQ